LTAGNIYSNIFSTERMYLTELIHQNCLIDGHVLPSQKRFR
jgi:hypothetical protein